MSKYNFKQIEAKWRENWEKMDINPRDESKPKMYCLDMFPYPSGDGLHMGHWRGYVLSDVLARRALMDGHFVIHPMGWDAFGLPAENFAIENEIHPEKAVRDSIEFFKRQLKEIGAMYNWDMELNTTDPEFYKWTQWIFVEMFKRGLAYEKEMPLNWCEACKVVLANEEAAGGECERCGGITTKRNLRQWMLKITDYAQRLLDDLEGLNWPEKVKKMQAEWIGRSHGARIHFPVQGRDEKIEVFTTRPDTLFGATFMVLAPEHPLTAKIVATSHAAEVEEYVKNSATISNVDRMAKKDKTGVFTGAYATNPLSGADMEIWVSDYVLADYGTGAIMCVPGHDERDFEFAKKFGLPILQVISPDGSLYELEEAYLGEGVMVNSGDFNGTGSEAGREAVANHLAERDLGCATINYRLRDWVFSRQRYWGEPIPLIHCGNCGVVPVPYDDLPVTLPHVASYKPTDTGESPLALIDEWVNTPCPDCGGAAKRETNTMPQWAGSSWYFLRYLDVGNRGQIISGQKAEKYLPVDYYVGGVEHAVLHLLYARFYTKFLYDIGVVGFEEPFTRLFNQGMINRFGKKMSKSAGNGVSPDEILPKYGCDTLRMYILFIGPPELDAEWTDTGIEGVYRFLNKLWRLVAENAPKVAPATAEHEKIRHKMIRDITWRIDNLSLNTAVSGFMEYTNKLSELARGAALDQETLETLVIMLAPFAPHIAEELWEILGHNESVFRQPWPVYDAAKAADDMITMVVQINGKLRANTQVSADIDKDAAIAAAREAVAARLEGQTIVKEIFVPKKLVNFVVK
ncbi:MAG: leucine--tRNA ligase [Clostridiales bacterium]|jgi:leucyl-tRNA synthetase|nr:leucine--tRNA ligase [Clostridiales bacterium]